MFRSKLFWVGFGRFWRNKAGALFILLAVLLFGAGTAASSTLAIPTLSIASVTSGETVTVQTHNFPAGQSFTVRMGQMGTLGIGGTVVGTTESGDGGSFAVTYNIPEALKDNRQIAIRLESAQGYYSYNWFYNNSTTGGTTPPTTPVYSGIPTFKVTEVKEGESVTIETNNFPANMTFAVTIGKMFTRGIGGTHVGDIESGDGGRLTATFNIPEGLKDDARISIRAQTAHANPFFAYNWFHNYTASSGNADNANAGNGATGGGSVVQTGIPTFTVCTVTKDGEVTILTKNFPKNQTCTVTMGAMFTRGVGGTQVGALESGDNSSARYAFNIPDGLKGAGRISIRAQTGHANPFFAYNWFHNATTSQDHCQ